MNNAQASRWISLLEGIECIQNYSEQNKIKITEYDLKITALKRYIKDRAPTVELALNKEDKLNHIKKEVYLQTSTPMFITSILKESL